MMKRIDLLRLVFVAGMFLFASFSVNAATSDALDDAAWLDTMKKGNGDSFYPPYDKNWQGEQISTESGGLNMRVTDLTLPGKNGLDLKLIREYSNLKNMETFHQFSGRQTTKTKPAYVYKDPETGKSYYILFDNEESMLNVAPDEFYASSTNMENFKRVEQIGSVKKTYYPVEKIYRTSTDPNVFRLVRDKTLSAVNINVTAYFDLEPSNFQFLYNIGYNWQFVLPQISFTHSVDNGPYNFTNYGSVTDFDGNTYAISTTAYLDTVENTWKPVNFLIDTEPVIYTGEYLSYQAEEHEPGIIFNRKMTDSKGRTMYFSGTRIVAVKDRYQNQILFAYNNDNQLSSITDTYGRVVTLTYSGTGVVVTYTQPETNEPRTISYETGITYNPDDPGNMYTTDDT